MAKRTTESTTLEESEIEIDSSTIKNVRANIPPLSRDTVSISEVFNPGIGDQYGGPELDSSGKILQMTDNVLQKRAIWAKRQLDLKYDFVFDSYMYFGNRVQQSGSGITFALQTIASDHIGHEGHNLAVYGKDGSKPGGGIAVEFDTEHDNPGNDQNVPIKSTYDHTAFVDIRNPEYPLQYQTVLNADSDDQLAAGYWYKIRISWIANYKMLRYELEALNSTDKFVKQDKSIFVDTKKIFRTDEEFPKVWWGYTAATRANWDTNAVAFQSVPQAANQDVSLVVRDMENQDMTAYDEDSITVKIKRNALYSKWDNVNTVIDYSDAKENLSKDFKLEINGKHSDIVSDLNGKLVVPTTSLSKNSDTITLTFTGKYVAGLEKNIKVSTTGRETISLEDGTGYTYENDVEDEVKLTVKQDLVSIEAKDSTINTGSIWNPIDNFVSATNEEGEAVEFSDDKITVNISTINTSVVGKYFVKYTYQGLLKKVEKQVEVIVTGPLSISVPERVDFGSYYLGTQNSVLPYIGEDIIVKDSRYQSNGWILTANLEESSPGFSNFVMNGEGKLSDSNLIASSEASGTKIINQNWSEREGVYIDYSNVNTIRQDSARIVWALSPSIKEVNE